MIVGISGSIYGFAHGRFEWTCPAASAGEILGAHIGAHISNGFAIAEFGVIHAGGAEEWLVRAEEHTISWATPTGACKTAACAGRMPTPPTLECPACRLRVQSTWAGAVDATSFVALATAHPIEMDIDDGDKLVVVAVNLTGANQTFNMGVRLGERGVSRVPLWWANVDTGRLERALTFPERRLPKGTKIGGLVVVDPATYDGFDMKEAASS